VYQLVVITPLWSLLAGAHNRRRLWWSLTVFVVALNGAPTTASTFVIPHPPAALIPDANTLAIYAVTPASLAKGEIVDASGKAQPGQLRGKWQAGETGEALEVLSSKGSADRSELVFGDLKPFVNGAFSVDVVLRWGRGQGYFLRVGKAPAVLLMGVLHRGPGLFELRVPVKTAGGEVVTRVLESSEIYRDAGPVRPGEFYTYTLSYDGKRNFRVLIDGRQVFTADLPEGERCAASGELAVGNVASWKSEFIGGEIAQVRVSDAAKSAMPLVSFAGVGFDPKASGGWIFDAGTPESPVQAGAIALTSAHRYKDDPKRGFGWIEHPQFCFDAWYVAGRFAATPELAYNKAEHKILGALERDGAVVNDGEFFRADIPDGRYWVVVETGHNSGSANIASLSANGTILGEALRTNANLFRNAIVNRTARGVVMVAGGRGLVLSSKSAKDGGDLPVKSIEILPYVPLPFAIENHKLVWRSQGTPPAALSTVTTALEKGDLKAARQAADTIEDSLLQVCALAYIEGHPRLPDSADVTHAENLRLRQISLLKAQPTNPTLRWLFDSTERLRYVLDGYVNGTVNDVIYGSRFGVWAQSANLGLTLRPEDPGYWQGKFLAGASIWQMATQASSFPAATTDYYKTPENMRAFEAPGKLFGEITAVYPEFRIARIMHGERVPAGLGGWTPPSNAPEWASLQYELLHHVVEVLHYWVNERMDARGLLGGGVGDDVEALRWWGPGVLLADDAVTKSGWTRLTDAAWATTGGTGYSRDMDDVEHSAEPTGDSLPLYGLIHFDTPQMTAAMNRLTKTSDVFQNLWTVEIPGGMRMFKGHFLNATKIDREGDVPYNLRAIRPLVMATWLEPRKYPDLEKALTAYANSWREATMREFDGKPRGIVPMMIMPDRKAAKFAKAKDWVFPGYWSYKYPAGYMEKVYDLMLGAYVWSGDTAFLEPVKFGLTELRKIKPGDEKADAHEPGSLNWALRSASERIAVAGANYRLKTGDRSFDDVLLRFGSTSMKFQLLSAKAKSPSEFAAALAPSIEKLRLDVAAMNSNPEMRTIMVQSTDRIYVSGTRMITAMATGMAFPTPDSRGDETYWPSFQVTWQNTNSEVAAYVQTGSTSELKVLLYSFAAAPKIAKPRLWNLEAGEYQLVLTETDSTGFSDAREVARRIIKIERPGQAIECELPSKTPLRLSLILRK
jgi:hypothetical protein